MSNYYYHYMGNAKKSINIFYSLNKVTYSPRYAFADWEEGNTPPKIYVRFLSARIQSTEDFRFLTSFCAHLVQNSVTPGHTTARVGSLNFSLRMAHV